jgi:hypothetical protein
VLVATSRKKSTIHQAKAQKVDRVAKARPPVTGIPIHFHFLNPFHFMNLLLATFGIEGGIKRKEKDRTTD